MFKKHKSEKIKGADGPTSVITRKKGMSPSALRRLQNRLIAVLCIVVMMAAVTSSALALNSYKAEQASDPESDTVTRALAVNMQQKSTYAPSVSYNITLIYASVELDLSVTVVDEYGDIVAGYPFEVTITSDQGYEITQVDEDRDGQIYFSNLTEGDYTMKLAPATGYNVTEEAIPAVVSPKVTYEKVDVSKKIKQASEIDVANEDKQYNNGGHGADTTNETTPVPTPTPTPTPTPSTTDTVDFVVSEKKETTATVEKPVTDSAGNQIVKYKPALSADGYLLLADGSTSDYKAIVDENGYLTGATRTTSANTTLSYRTAGHSYVFLTETEQNTEPSLTSEVDPSTETTPTDPVTPTEPVTVTYSLSGSSLVASDGSASVDLSVFSITSVPQTEQVTETTITYYGWQTLDGKTYYFDKNGKKVTGTQVIQGVTYNFDSEGAKIETTSKNSLGIDVSTWQDYIDWTKVKAAGIDFAFIRVGFRGYGSGSLVEDSRFRENIRNATAAGLKVGVYFFTQAVNEQEAVEEASMCLQLVQGYRLAYPIAIDIEYAAASARTNGMNNAQRTKVCVAFCETIKNAGYTPAVYANKYYLTSMLNTSQLEGYVIWLAHYTTATSYSRRYDIWQYSSKGTVDGISGSVDMNISYLGY